MFSPCDDQVFNDAVTLFQINLDFTFEILVRFMAWLAIMLNWECRCMARNKTPTWHQFVRLWAAQVKSWSGQIVGCGVVSFDLGVQNYLGKGTLLTAPKCGFPEIVSQECVQKTNVKVF